MNDYTYIMACPLLKIYDKISFTIQYASLRVSEELKIKYRKLNRLVKLDIFIRLT